MSDNFYCRTNITFHLHVSYHVTKKFLPTYFEIWTATSYMYCVINLKKIKLRKCLTYYTRFFFQNFQGKQCEKDGYFKQIVLWVKIFPINKITWFQLFFSVINYLVKEQSIQKYILFSKDFFLLLFDVNFNVRCSPHFFEKKIPWPFLLFVSDWNNAFGKTTKPIVILTVGLSLMYSTVVAYTFSIACCQYIN